MLRRVRVLALHWPVQFGCPRLPPAAAQGFYPMTDLIATWRGLTNYERTMLTFAGLLIPGFAFSFGVAWLSMELAR